MARARSVASSSSIPGGGEGNNFGLFYGLKANDRSMTGLEENLAVFSSRLPAGVIPIADDGGGDQICLGLEGDERGRVFYWAHDRDLDGPEYRDARRPVAWSARFRDIIQVADSFTDFLASLEGCDDDEI